MEKELQNIKVRHDKKHAELSPSDDSKIQSYKVTMGNTKTQPNSLLNAATGASTSATKEETKTRYTAEILYDEIKPIIQRNKTGRYGRNKAVGIKPTKTGTKPATRAIRQNFISRANGKLLQNYRTQISGPQPAQNATEKTISFQIVNLE
ncbi:hypothetical protein H5410_036324 [Solanum commersonii]|uniref:Uncharacterized protein n=1 Tax=Solanum commersonii TaxID=4109 RepID=A0A9J5Y757_SOLCO|nr:hypothetical protein H5410_036324 [Solanum commersonii]